MVQRDQSETYQYELMKRSVAGSVTEYVIVPLHNLQTSFFSTSLVLSLSPGNPECFHTMLLAFGLDNHFILFHHFNLSQIECYYVCA